MDYPTTGLFTYTEVLHYYWCHADLIHTQAAVITGYLNVKDVILGIAENAWTDFHDFSGD